ncbi:FAD binding domain-containing protein [Xylariomycetidae sp. FL2044]|nr:FAD binding domain-containing protein [Xylariomycetidae sp. FL2044]
MTKDSDPPLRLDVAVIGAGIAGLAAAVETALSGHRVIVFESADRLHEIGAGLQITPNASRLLQRWGLPDELWASAAEPTTLSVRRYSGEVLAREENFDDKMRKRYGVPFVDLHRVDLQNALYARAKELGVHFRFGEAVARVDFDRGHVTTRGSGGGGGGGGEEEEKRVTADVFVAADGLWSKCRADFVTGDLAETDPPKPTGDLAYRMILTLDQIRDPALREWVRRPSVHFWIGPRSHAVGYSVRAGTMYNVVLLVPDDLPSGVTKQVASVEEMRKRVDGWDPVLNKFLDLVSTVRKWKLMHRSELPSWIHVGGSSSFAFVGDSCHPMLPYLAQGANSALEDGAVLGRLLGHVRSRDQIGEALRRYEKLRKPRGEAIAKEAFGQRESFHMVNGPEQEARDRVFLSQLGREEVEAPFPSRWTCPQVQPWLFGYDAYAEVERAMRDNPFPELK